MEGMKMLSRKLLYHRLGGDRIMLVSLRNDYLLAFSTARSKTPDEAETVLI